jgi:hypothetical protein
MRNCKGLNWKQTNFYKMNKDQITNQNNKDWN